MNEEKHPIFFARRWRLRAILSVRLAGGDLGLFLTSNNWPFNRDRGPGPG